MTRHTPMTKVDEFAKAVGIDLGDTPDPNGEEELNDRMLDAVEVGEDDGFDEEESLSNADFWNRLHRAA
jgi:hypothetical protein